MLVIRKAIGGERPMEASQNAYDMTTPLLRQVPQTALDAVFGASALVTPDLKLAVVGRAWDEFMSRSGRSDLGRNAVLGGTILLFFRNDEQRRVFESLLHSMHSDEIGVHNQVVDLGTKEKPFYVQMHAQGLWQDGVFAGYFVHCLDITREHGNRLSLIERDREMMASRESAEKAILQVTQLQEKLRLTTEEIAQREVQLKKMAEKSVRMEKSSQEALERAGKSVEKSSRLQHELDKIKKQQLDSSKAEAELASQLEAVSLLTKELGTAQTRIAELQQELKDLGEQKNGQATEVSSSAQENETLRLTIEELTAEQEVAQTVQAKLQNALSLSAQEVSLLREALAEAEKVPAPVPVIEKSAKSSVEIEFLSYLTQRACCLDPKGNFVCGTGSFWEKLGALPEQEIGQSFTRWLSDPEVKVFNSWLREQSDVCCMVSGMDGSQWRVCAVINANGDWQGASVEEHFVPEQIVALPAVTLIEFAPQSSSQVRLLSRELADEFSNLLTGVLGHASLAAAELDGTPSRDIIAIEKTAREAAQLVRKLSALGGQGRHAHEIDIAPLLLQYVKKIQQNFFDERPQIVLCDDGCRVNAETNSLRMVFEAIATHARDHCVAQSQVCFTLSHTESAACLTLSYDGLAGLPAGWNDGLPPTVGQAGWELIFAREVVRGMSGELELSCDSNRSMLLVTLPLITSKALV